MPSNKLSGASTLWLQTGIAPVGMQASSFLTNGMSPTPISTSQNVQVTGQPGLTSAGVSVGTAGVGQIAPSVPQNSFGAGTASLGVGQSVSSVNTDINGTQGTVGMGQRIPGMVNGGMTTGSLIGQNGVGMSRDVLCAMGPVGISSGAGTMISKPSLNQSVQVGDLQALGGGNTFVGNLQLPSTATTTQQPEPAVKYTKFWEGMLGGQRQGKFVSICRLEAYRNITSPETLAADWPTSKQIIRLISQEHITNKNYEGKAEYLIFRPMSQHGFLVQLSEKKLSAVIQLPNQLLLLSSCDRPGRMIGMLFPGDTVVFRPKLPNQSDLQQQPPLQQQQQHQPYLEQQLQQQQQQLQQQQQQLQQQQQQLQQQQQQLQELQQQLQQIQQQLQQQQLQQ